MTRPLVRAFAAVFLAVVVCVGATGPTPALAQDSPAADSVNADDVRRLVNTLEDDAEREKLVKQLKTLVQARKASAPQEDEGVLGSISSALEDLGNGVLDAVGIVQDLPKLANWANASLRDPAVRHLWGNTLWKLVAMVLAGMVADYLAKALLRRPERMLMPPDGAHLMTRAPLALARAVVRLIPIAAFAGAAYGMLTVLAINGNARVAGLMVVTAYVAVRAVMILIRAVAAPRTASLRLIPVDDETAEYLVIWARRLTGLGMFGVFAIEAARLLGLPRGGYQFLFKTLGLAMATMVVIFIMQNRAPVAKWLRNLGNGHKLGGRMQGLRNRLAEIWHILASLYVVAGYLIWASGIKGGFEFMLRASILTVVILLVAGLLSGGLRRAIERGFALSHEAKQQFPQLEDRANRYLPILHVVLRGAVVVITVLAVAQAWGLDSIGMLSSPVGRRVVSSVISIAVVLVIALVVWELVAGAIERYLDATDTNGIALERSARARTLLPLMRNAVLVVLLVMVTLIVLSEVGVNIAPLLAGAGVLGVAVGFGSQKLVQDVITGAFILFEDTMAVGDVVQLGSHSGVVESMTIRAIRLRDFNGAIHTLPFSSVSDVVNMTKDFSFAVFEVGVAYREDADEVMTVLKDLGAELQADPEFGPLILEPLEIVGLDRFDASSVVIKARFKTLPIKQWSVMREFNRRMKRRFDELGIEIPFPQTTVWFGQDRQGNAPAARIALDPQAGGPEQPKHPAHVAPPAADASDVIAPPTEEKPEASPT